MDWKEIGRTAASVGAPLLGGALFGPAGAAVGSIIAAQFGVSPDATPDQVLTAIKGDPDAALKLRKIETDHVEHLQTLENERLRIETADVQNARSAHQHHWMPSAITLLMCAMFGMIIGALFIWAVPGDNKDIVVYITGQVSGILTSCVTYWVGSTRASANKDVMRR
ncbi:hypothetical protein D3C77_28860 [compost metagenome]